MQETAHLFAFGCIAAFVGAVLIKSLTDLINKLN